MIIAAVLCRGCGYKCGQGRLAGKQVGKSLVLCPRPLTEWAARKDLIVKRMRKNALSIPGLDFILKC